MASSAQWRSSKTRTVGRSLGEVLQEPSPGGELLVALGLDAGLDAEQRQQPLAEPGRSSRLGQDRVELRRRDVDRVRLEDARRAP